MMKTLYVLAALRSVSALVPAPDPVSVSTPVTQQHSEFQCDLPPALDPAAKDSLPSAKDLFSSQGALEVQIRRHQAVVRVPSVSYDDLGPFDKDNRWKPFYELRRVLAETYPFVHRRSKVERINTFGLVYTVQGTNTQLKPLLLAAHQDVVPVENSSSWKYPPFSGHWDGEYLWGRGSVDDKGSLTATMSALETLLSNRHWRPRRTVIMAFGFDEEIKGVRGAAYIAVHLRKRYGPDGLAMVIDEGGMGINRIGQVVYAVPAVLEKSYLDVWFHLEMAGGHSSTPVPHTAIGIMADAVTALEAAPFAPELRRDGPLHHYLLCKARYSPDAQPELTKLLRGGDLAGAARFMANDSLSSRYMLQTSQAVDVIHGGDKINALPEDTTLGINYRVAPQDSVPAVQYSVVRRVRDVVAKYGVQVRAFEGDAAYEAYGTLILTAKDVTFPTPVSPSSGPIWNVLAGTIRHSVRSGNETVVPAGGIMNGNTDARHYI
ncbi:hypothetical protein E4U43_004554, partial [Claviceps pusilla]